MKPLSIAALALTLALTGLAPARAGIPADYLAAVRLQESHRYNENAVRAFVHNLFFQFDRHAPVEGMLNQLVDDRLNMVFPEATLRSHADFRAWYAGIGKNLRSNTHTVRSIAVRPLGPAEWEARVVVRWRAVDRSGNYLEFVADQLWTLVEGADGLRIRDYLVRPAR